MKPRVALCLSGEARTYDLAYPSFLKHIIEPLSPDIFISTWDSDFLMSDVCSSVEDYVELYRPVDFEVEQLNKQNIDIQRDVTDIGTLNNLLLTYLTPQNIDLFKGQKYLAAMEHAAGIRAYTMVNMFYKNWRCFHLCLNWAEAKGINYDLVIRSRPDLKFDQPLNSEMVDSLINNKNRICVPSFGWNGQSVADAFAYGSTHAIYCYTNIFLELERYFYNTKVNMKPDFLLKTHLEQQGIEIVTDNMPHDCLRPAYNTMKGLWYPPQ